MMDIKKKSGITLTELLVASILIGIVMLGVASFSSSIRQLHNSTNKSAILAMRMNTAMTHLVKDAMLAVGDAGNPGVYSWTDDDDQNSLCFRHDTSQTPEDYTDDVWTCYYHGNSYTIDKCVGSTWDFEGVGACQLSADCCQGAGPEIEILNLPKEASTSTFATVTNGSVQISLTSRFIQDDPAHPILNPENTLSTTINLPGHSW